MISSFIFCYIYIKSKINSTHDSVTALFMNNIFNCRTICINNLMKSI